MKTIYETISHILELLGPDVLGNRTVLLNAIEDSSPQLADELAFLRIVYTDGVADRVHVMYKKGNTSSKEFASEIMKYLTKQCGISDEWSRRFIKYFEILFKQGKSKKRKEYHDNRITIKKTKVTQKKYLPLLSFRRKIKNVVIDIVCFILDVLIGILDVIGNIFDNYIVYLIPAITVVVRSMWHVATII